MDILRHKDYFNPITVNKQIHIIGVGAVGSHIASNLTRLGISKIHIWDIDTVSSYNIPNQLFVDSSIKMLKTTAIAQEIQRINPNIEIIIHKAYTNEKLNGYVFLCLDSIALRKKFYKENRHNLDLEYVFDTRIALENGQVFTTKWNLIKPYERIISYSNFKENEVKVDTAACGSKLAILPTVVYAATIATAQFINIIKKEPEENIPQVIYFNAFKHILKRL